MDALKAELARKRKAKEEAFGGRKFVKRSEIEAEKLRQKLEEERLENEERVRKKEARMSRISRPDSPTGSKVEQLESPSARQPKVEVIRRLRMLGEPATLFGEDDADREKRLREAEKNVRIDDVDNTGGQQGNDILELRKQEKEQKKLDAQLAAAKAALEKGRKAGGGGAEEEDDPAAALAEAFRQAAGKVAQEREEADMCPEDKIYRFFKRLSNEWEEEMNSRPEEIKRTMSGENATRAFKQTMIYLKPMWVLLKRREMDEDLVRGLYLILVNMRERNYLAATDVYLKLAIGNSAWPIGVTSVGIHERSAREKISHVMNGKAHVMNDEATRKYLQGVKRLLTFSQRKYPALPSRCIDFNAYNDLGRGGAGSDLKALQESVAAREDAETLQLANAPHWHDRDGSVLPPRTLNSVLKHALPEGK